MTGNKKLDKIFLEAKGPILVYGEAGVGKTNLALHVARLLSIQGKNVLYINTEGWAYKGRVCRLNGLDNVVFIDISDFWIQTLLIVSKLPSTYNRFRAIIVDTINNLFRIEESLEAATRALSAQMATLHLISSESNVLVLVLGQVRAYEGNEEISGSTYIRFWSTTILRIEKANGYRLIVLEKPRKEIRLKFKINDKGIVWV